MTLATLKQRVIPEVSPYLDAHHQAVADRLALGTREGMDIAALSPTQTPAPGHPVLLHGTPQGSSGLVLAVADYAWCLDSLDREDPKGATRRKRAANWRFVAPLVVVTVLGAVVSPIIFRNMPFPWPVTAVGGAIAAALITLSSSYQDRPDTSTLWNQQLLTHSPRPVRFDRLRAEGPQILSVEPAVSGPGHDSPVPGRLISAIYLPTHAVQTWQSDPAMGPILESLKDYHHNQVPHTSAMPQTLATAVAARRLQDSLDALG